MMGRMPGPLDAHDPDVERAMKSAAQLTPMERDEFMRTVYRYVYAYRRTRNPNLLIELVNSAVGSVALRENPEYARALEDLQAARDATQGQPPVDVRQLLEAERERRAG
jgi:hypothetical protein